MIFTLCNKLLSYKFFTIKIILLKKSFTQSFAKLTTSNTITIQVQTSYIKTKTQN